MKSVNNRSVRLLAAFSAVLFAVAVFTAWAMYDRYRADMLWGYRPLWFLLSAWLGMAALILSLNIKITKTVNLRRMGLSTLSALLLSLGFPGFLPFPWLAFAGFVPLFILEKEISAEHNGSAKRRLFPYIYFSLVLWNIITTFWVANSAIAAGLFAILVNSLLMCIPFLLFHQTWKIVPRFGYASFIVYWLSFEYLHLRWDLTWPWLTLGNSFAQIPATVQWYEFTGVFGGSLWILLMNVLLFRAYEEKQLNLRRPGKQLAGIAVLALAPILLSLIQYFSYKERGDLEADVLVIQPNFEPHYEKFSLPEEYQLGEFLELTHSRVDSAVDYVVFPESSFGFMETTRINEHPAIVRLRQSFAGLPGLTLVTGLDAYHDLQPGESKSEAVRVRKGEGGRPIFYEVYNLAAQLVIGEEEVQQYKKSKLVPGPERFPFKRILFFMEPVVAQLGGTSAGLGVQKNRGVFTNPPFSIAPVICYESVFGAFFAGYVRAGAQAAFIVTNDGWWDNTQGHRQHLYFASLRAIETRRPIARSANTGISAFINQRGDIEQTLPYGVEGTLRQRIRTNDQITFYVRWGDMIGRIALYTAGLFFLLTVVTALRNTRRPELSSNGK